MASKIAEAYVQIVPRIDGVASSINSQLAGPMGAAGVAGGNAFGGGLLSSIKRFAGPMAATLGTVGIANFFKDAVTGASNFQAEFEGVNQVFGKNAKAIQDYAKTASKTAGLSETEALKAAKSFGIFSKQANLAGKDAVKFSLDMTQLAGDLGSFNDVPTAEALAAIQSGLMGQAEPLRKFGVFLTDGALKQEAMNLKLYDGKGALDASARMMASYSLIMKDTTLQQGDFAKYSEDFGNALKTAQTDGANLSKEIGTVLLPMLTNMVIYVRDEVIPKVSGFVQAFKDGKTPINDVVTALGGFVGFVVDNWGSISSMATPILGAVAAFKAYKIALELAAIAQGVFNTVMMANPVAIAITAIGVAIGFTINFFTKYKKENEKLVADIKAIWDGIVKWFSDLGARVVEGLWNGLKKSFPSVTNWMEQSAKDLAAAFAKNMGIRSPSRVFDEFGQNIGEGLVNGMDSMQGAVEKSARELGSYANKGFTMSLKELTAAGNYGTLAGTKFFKATDPSQVAAMLGQGGVLDVNGVTLADLKAAISSDAAGNEKLAKGAKKSGQGYYANPALMALLEKAGYTFKNGYSVQEEGMLLQELTNRLQGGFSTNYTAANGRAMSTGSTPIMELTSEALNSTFNPLIAGTKFDAISKASIETFIAKQQATLAEAAAWGGSNSVLSPEYLATVQADLAKAQKLIAPVVKAAAKAPKKIPKLAAGGFVNDPTMAIIGEAGPEVVTPLKDFERMMGINGGGKTIIYNAAPNESIDREEALFKAMRRAKVVAGW